ncbi:MAG: septum formation initiator family protein [Bacillota bacterium]
MADKEATRVVPFPLSADKPTRRRRKIRLSWGRIGFSLFVVYLILTFIRVELRIYGLRQEIATLNREIAALSEEAVRLEQEVEYLSSSEYVERAARESLGMIKENELLYLPAVPKK